MAERSAHLLLILIILSMLTIAHDPAQKAPSAWAAAKIR